MDREVGLGDVIRVTSLFFASYRDLLGTAEVEVELPVGASVRDLVQVIRQRAGGDGIPASPAVAVNREYSRPERKLNDGDEVAFIPPVAGG